LVVVGIWLQNNTTTFMDVFDTCIKFGNLYGDKPEPIITVYRVFPFCVVRVNTLPCEAERKH